MWVITVCQSSRLGVSGSQRLIWFYAKSIIPFNLGRHCLSKYPFRGFWSSKVNMVLC